MAQACARRRRAISAYSATVSMSTQRRPCFRAARARVPAPPKGDLRRLLPELLEVFLKAEVKDQVVAELV